MVSTTPEREQFQTIAIYAVVILTLIGKKCNTLPSLLVALAYVSLVAAAMDLSTGS